jgi:hypothetical protein
MKQNFSTKKLTLLILVVNFLLGASSAYPQPQPACLKVRLSYKIFVNPKNGERPKLNGIHSHEYLTDEVIIKAVDEMNDLFSSFQRPLRFEVVEIKEIGFADGQKNKGKDWFHLNFTKDQKHINKKKDLEKAAKENSELYGWRDDAINFYINQGTEGGLWYLGNMVIMGSGIAGEGWRHLHELGHYFGLSHTHGFQCGLPKKGMRGKGHTEPGDDRIEDTLEDLPTWDLNKIAKHNFGKKYNKLSATEREQVNNVAENIMSYHFIKPVKAELTRLTQGQLDKFMDVVNSFANARIRDGRIWVVDDNTEGTKEGTFQNPFVSIERAIERANPKGGDILYINSELSEGTINTDKQVTVIQSTEDGMTYISSYENEDQPMLAAK